MNEFKYTIVQDGNFDQVMEKLASVKEAVLDTETNGFNWECPDEHIVSIGVTPINGSEVYYFPFRHVEEVQTDMLATSFEFYHNLSSLRLVSLMDYLSGLKTVVAHNAGFDVAFMAGDGFVVSEDMVIKDTCAYMRYVESSDEDSVSLENCIARHLSVDGSKYKKQNQLLLQKHNVGYNCSCGKRGKNYGAVPIKDLAEYCSKDVWYTQRLFHYLLDKFSEYNKYDSKFKGNRFEFVDKFTKTLIGMESRGVFIDQDALAKMETAILSKVESIKDQLRELGYTNSPTESKYKREYLANKGLKSNQKTGTGQDSWSAANLAKANLPEASLLAAYSKIFKLYSTYIAPYTGKSKIFPRFNISATITGRISSSNPNIQNLPSTAMSLGKIQRQVDVDIIKDRLKTIVGGDVNHLTEDNIKIWSFLDSEPGDEGRTFIRNLIKPRQDYYLVSLDFSQMEVIFLLEFAKERGLLGEIINGKDIHSLTTNLVFNKSESDPDFDYYRKIGKQITFSVVYGQGDRSLAISLGTTADKAKQWRSRFFEQLGGVKSFLDKVSSNVEKHFDKKHKDYRLYSMYGRPYFVWPDEFYKMQNYLIQGSAADMVNECTIKTHKLLSNKRSALLFSVHDELLLEVHQDELDVIADVYKTLVVNRFNVPMKLDIEVYPDK